MTKVKELEDKIEALIAKLKSLKDSKYTEKDIEVIQNELHEIDEQYNDGAIKVYDAYIFIYYRRLMEALVQGKLSFLISSMTVSGPVTKRLTPFSP